MTDWAAERAEQVLEEYCTATGDQVGPGDDLANLIAAAIRLPRVGPKVGSVRHLLGQVMHRSAGYVVNTDVDQAELLVLAWCVQAGLVEVDTERALPGQRHPLPLRCTPAGARRLSR